MTLIAVNTLKNSGEETETEWASSLTGVDLSFFTKVEDVPVTIIDGVVTFTDPALLQADYFIFKNARTWALYDINGTTGTVDLNADQFMDYNYGGLVNGTGVVSHVSFFLGKSDPHTVPDGGALGLMLVGAMMLGFIKRRNNV